jgi:hypothetical protein
MNKPKPSNHSLTTPGGSAVLGRKLRAGGHSRATILVLLLIFRKVLVLDVALALDGQPQRLDERRQQPDDDPRSD